MRIVKPTCCIILMILFCIIFVPIAFAAPPSVAITAPTGGTFSGDVTITYILTDANSDTCSITVEYTTDAGSTWQVCGQGPGGDGVSGLDSSVSGATHTFVWASANDNVGRSAIETVQVRITPHDGTASGTPDVSTPFNVDNTGITGPVASFDTSVTSGTAPLTAQFTDTSTGVYDSWCWDFDGDGLIDSTQQNPNFTYRLVGTYSVTLTIDGPDGDDSVTRTSYITVADPGWITADFSAAPTAGPPPLDVQFEDLSFGNITSWSWDFGDGGTSTQSDPAHEYAGAGVYTVILTVTGPSGSDTLTKSNYIAVRLLVASFSASPTTGDAPLAVQFTDTSTGTATSWWWNFGDGTMSVEQDPSHVYTFSGEYTVSLMVRGLAGTDTVSKTGFIIVTGAAPPPPKKSKGGCKICTIERMPTLVGDLFGYFIPAMVIALAYLTLRRRRATG